jgi:hypothetical protein
MPLASGAHTSMFSLALPRLSLPGVVLLRLVG